MKTFTKKKALSRYLDELRAEGKQIGLVPTMGALHRGHLALLDFIKDYCDVRVCSIFVNPTQFNNEEDLRKYPRPIEKDKIMLEEEGCEIVFIPEVEEMYENNEYWHINLEGLDQQLEGAFRPGHYQGVTQIVKKLLDIVEPNVACFGQKDFQQYLVIEKMIRLFNIPVKLFLCPTVREKDGLAMSSRNVRLSPEGYQKALVIGKTLTWFSLHCNEYGLEEARKQALMMLEGSDGLILEYFSICNPEDLQPVTSESYNGPLIVLLAAWVDGVRLIDNMVLNFSKK